MHRLAVFFPNSGFGGKNGRRPAPPLDITCDQGENALMQISPLIVDHIGRTPMVRLSRVAAGLPATVLGKCEFLNPGGSVKDRIALAIIEEAERRGQLAPGATLVEATAGNTGLGLALVAAARGYRLVCVMPEKMSVDKRVALEAVGALVIINPQTPRLPLRRTFRMSLAACPWSGAGF